MKYCLLLLGLSMNIISSMQLHELTDDDKQRLAELNRQIVEENRIPELERQAIEQLYAHKISIKKVPSLSTSLTIAYKVSYYSNNGKYQDLVQHKKATKEFPARTDIVSTVEIKYIS